MQRKTRDDKELFLKEYKSIKNSEISFDWFLKHIKARYLVMNNELLDGLTHYEQALEMGSYRAGKLLNRIIKEGLVLSAYLNKKRAFEKFYKRAYLYNLITDSIENNKEWIIDHFRKDFDKIFSKGGFYENINTRQ